MSVDLSHDVTFDKTYYPGISSHTPTGLIAPLDSLSEEFSNVEEPSLASQPVDNPADSSGDSENEVELQLVGSRSPTTCPSDSSSRRNPGRPSTVAVPHQPGFDVVLQPANQKSPSEILSNIDEGNILDTCWRAHMAIVNRNFDLNVQFFLAGAQFFDQKSEAPKSYSKAMKSPESANWAKAVVSEFSTMDRLAVWKIVNIPPGANLLGTV
ncbi:hypothetical protein PCANC_22470 [Puccinia coronata f. sp. avenae]|nr:hypothetical protein PCANC_28271 [Puccinia coronata f. sp. avenae]PLW08114.1 hypothetical protein PCANC_22470 [Puccinia coronata f. sp. avenae]